ncbi:MAG: CPBP family intramembrane glutamic endopeptidase [Fimbriiglobus sp.]
MPRYLTDARHPWPCLLFVLPLLAVYEGGIRFLAAADPGSLRNGADVWLQIELQKYGVENAWTAPLIVTALLFLRTWLNWASRPKDVFTVVFGMAVESMLFAVLLWTIARNLGLLMHEWGVPAASVTFHTPAAGEVITYVGAGVYEEVIFRLGLFSLAAFLLRVVKVPWPAGIILAALGSALAFAAAHHVGPNGEPMVPARFLFRTAAGLFFTVLYVLRGFGIAVGAHAGYDILVGTSVG